MIRRRRSVFDIVREMEEEVLRDVEWMLTQVKESELRSRCLEPLYEVRDLPDEVVVTIDIPRASKDDLRLRASERSLYLEAPCNYEVPLHSYYRRGATRYRLEIDLPEEVDPEAASSRYREGVLEVRLPKKRRGFRIRVE